ncbi:unnamed protein product [Clonostachys solani]|uniref:Uncharacterized protein n=1 Tax=Clonostachys solani TaxID=160281 RepID=A0A9N9W611_9HYPO|nr:unnamed protein product [Clonostachys solani]
MHNHLFGVLGTESLGGVDKVDEGLLGLLPLAGLETAVRVDPELLRLEVSKHFLDAILDLLLAGNTRGVDVVDTRANVARVSLVDEDLEELGIRLAVLDRENISVKSSNSMEEVLELRVAEVRVNLSVVLDTSSAESESLDGPVEVGSTLLAGAERETLTESRLIDLDDTDTGVLEVNNFVTESKSKLLSLDGLVDIVTRERPSEAGDGASKHTLHGLLRNADSVLGLLDSHRSRSGDVTDNDRGTDAARSVRLDPGVGGEGIAVQALTEELNHVVTLGLTVDEDIKVKLLLDLDVLLNLLLDELVVLSLGDFTLGEAVTLETDLLEGKVELLLLERNSGGELRLALVVSVGDLGLAVLDLGVVGAAGRGTSLERLGVGLELLADGSRALSDGLGNSGDLNSLLGGEREPVGNLSVELLLASESVGGVEERAGGGGDDAVLAELLNSSLNGLNSTLEVGLPDVTAVDNTGREDGVGAQGANHLIELLGVADKVDVDSVDVLGKNIQVVDDVTKVGGEDKLGDLVAEAGELLVSRLEGSLGLGREVKDQSGLINLDGLGTSLLELDKELLIDGQKSIEQVNGVDGLVTVGLSEVEEGDGTDEDGAGLDASLLGLVESGNSLGLVSELEGLAVLESGLDVVVVGVKPLDHLQARNVNAVLLVATAHGEVLVDEVKTILGVTRGNGL